jgi:hypothetical protein
MLCKGLKESTPHEHKGLQGQQGLTSQQAVSCLWPQHDVAQVMGKELGSGEVLF